MKTHFQQEKAYVMTWENIIFDLMYKEHTEFYEKQKQSVYINGGKEIICVSLVVIKKKEYIV